MNLSRNDLYRIILEEYLKEEGITEAPGDVLDLLRKIKRDPDYDPREDPGAHSYTKDGPPATTRTMSRPHRRDPQDPGETMPIGADIPSDDAPEGGYGGFQDRSGPPLEDRLMDLIQGMPPEEVADLFQVVFEKIPGIELSSPGDEDYPEEETLYSPGAEGRPVVRGLHRDMALQELILLIKEVIKEELYQQDV